VYFVPDVSFALPSHSASLQAAFVEQIQSNLKRDDGAAVDLVSGKSGGARSNVCCLTNGQGDMLASRTFTEADQIRFAALSGDRNPMHLDAVKARRTQAGVQVVHGIHLLLWALDALARDEVARSPVLRLRASFKRFVAIHETVALALARRTEVSARVDFVVAGLTVALISLDFGSPVLTTGPLFGDAYPAPAMPRDLSLKQMDGLSGRLAFVSTPATIAAMFPAASRWLGPRRVAALAATSLLVGMVCPGLHSIYGDLTVEACDEKDPEDRLGFRVVSTEPRFRLVRLAIEGGGLVGSIKTVARMPPTPQASSSELADVVESGEFAGSTALVVGGSRGLGEVTAKLLAAGGAQVIITYRVGRDEAEVAARDILAAGGMCETLAYDVGQPTEAQLIGLGKVPTHAYYFATPTIYRAQSALFERARLDAFLDVYVDGFLRLAQALRARRNDVSLLYPSSAYVAERPRGMLEYAMAKAAGETLCSEMNIAWAPMRVAVVRLPRLPTDQTASVMDAALPSPVAFLLPAVREAQSWPPRAKKEIPRHNDPDHARPSR
jgi:NAD(P)-dependent dehydrogenase (short-subunit alcohol dehydrogenase family)